MLEGHGHEQRIGVQGHSDHTFDEGDQISPNGNPLCWEGLHFDIAPPGFNILAYSLMHECPLREPEEANGKWVLCCIHTGDVSFIQK